MSAQSAATFIGVWGLLPQKIFQPTRSVLRIYRKSLMANSRTVNVASDLRSTTTFIAGARLLVARAHAPVCPSLATPLNLGVAPEGFGSKTKIRACYHLLFLCKKTIDNYWKRCLPKLTSGGMEDMEGWE